MVGGGGAYWVLSFPGVEGGLIKDLRYNYD